MMIPFELKPNCLITNRPLKLVSGPKSLFFYKTPWGLLPEVLYEHGYKASVLQLPFNNKQQRQIIFKKNLTELNDSHVIIDQASFNEFSESLQKLQNSTITVIGKDFKPQYSTSSLTYTIHCLWLKLLAISVSPPESFFLNAPKEVYYDFIDHCVKLAELDFMHKS